LTGQLIRSNKANLSRQVTVNEFVHPPNPAAARMRLHRDRRRGGLRCLTIELRETEIDALIEKRLLTSEMRHDPGAVCDALYLHLEQTLGSTVTRNSHA
jgi:hypothetical protein